MTPLLAILLILMTTRLLPLGVLALHLRWRRRYDTMRHDALVALASRLPPHAMIEWNDVRGDGGHVRLRVDASTEQRGRHDV